MMGYRHGMAIDFVQCIMRSVVEDQRQKHLDRAHLNLK